MITINFTRNNDGSIVLDRELTESEENTIVRRAIKQGSIDFYFIGDELPVSPEIKALNWYQLKVDLFNKCGNLIPQANTNFLTIFLTYLQDGQNGLSQESSFPTYFNLLGLTLTDQDRNNINKCLENNNFTIRF